VSNVANYKKKKTKNENAVLIILKPTATKMNDFIKQVNQNSIYKEIMIISFLQQ